MSPSDYFPDIYINDMSIFSDGRIFLHGPCEPLCGMTMSKVLEPDYRKKYSSIEAFIATVYCLNLINQGIYSYYNADFTSWCKVAEPFPDCRACGYHGGILTPGSILGFVSEASYITRATPVLLSDSFLKSYIEHIFGVYLLSLLEAGHFGNVKLDELMGALFNDRDCRELKRVLTCQP